jgi:4-amino-4-deoxy-L-arabinose transferase-like glycosyltransferase
MKNLKKYRCEAALCLIAALAGFLSVFNIWNEGYSNEFYAASVKSMTLSLKNFFFVSLDPGGWVTVDKPPVSLWLQALSAKVFGFYGWSIILPQCIAAVITVFVIYFAVKRWFGKGAGLISALVLALSPVFIIVSKTNNTDSILIMFMVFSAWALTKAVDGGRLKWLIISMVFLGIAYNAKTLEAYLILPALCAAYFFGADIKRGKRVLHLTVSLLVLFAVSLSWSAAVDLTPASLRPYVDNSTNNSELELAFGYNGIQRITGQSMRQSSGGGGGGGGKSGALPPGGRSQDGENSGSEKAASQSGSAGSGSAPASPPNQEGGGNGNAPQAQSGYGMPGGSPPTGENGNMQAPSGGGTPGGMGGSGRQGGGGSSMFNGGGSASILRMFNTTLGGQGSWLLPFGFMSMLALALGMRKSESQDKKARRKLLSANILWGGSVVTMFAYFSVAQFFHPYYVSVMAPFLAALCGAGFAQMWKSYRQNGSLWFLLPVSLLATGGVQAAMLVSYPAFAKILIPSVAVLTGIPAAVLTVLKLRGKAQNKAAALLAAVCFAGLLIAPAVWTSYSVFNNNFNAQIPSAGPSAGSSSGSGQPSGGKSESGGQSEKLISFLLKNNTGEKYLIAVPSASEAEPIILATGKPVMAVGGFNGGANTLTVAKLKQMVKNGEVKYFLVGGTGGSSSSEVTSWVEKNGTKVSTDKWSGTSSSSAGRGESSGTLYDLSAYKSK